MEERYLETHYYMSELHSVNFLTSDELRQHVKREMAYELAKTILLSNGAEFSYRKDPTTNTLIARCRVFPEKLLGPSWPLAPDPSSP
jgi:hypothetical protein